MEFLQIVERLADKVGLPGTALILVSFGVWQLLKPIINNINRSTETLVGISSMLAAHNQNALNMHQTCREHGEYICDTKDVLQDNHCAVMNKLTEIHGDIKKQ